MPAQEDQTSGETENQRALTAHKPRLKIERTQSRNRAACFDVIRAQSIARWLAGRSRGWRFEAEAAVAAKPPADAGETSTLNGAVSLVSYWRVSGLKKLNASAGTVCRPGCIGMTACSKSFSPL